MKRQAESVADPLEESKMTVQTIEEKMQTLKSDFNT